MIAMSRLMTRNNSHNITTMNVEIVTSRKNATKRTGFETIGSKLPVLLGLPSLNTDSSSHSPSATAHLEYANCHSTG